MNAADAGPIAIGCSTLGFRFDPLAVALTEIAGQGFRWVDLAMYPSYCPHFDPSTASAEERASLRGRLDEIDLTVATLNASDGLIGAPAQRERALAYARASLELARGLGAYGVTMQSGVEPPSREWSRWLAPSPRICGSWATTPRGWGWN